MYNRGLVPSERATAIWPVAEPPVAPDGPFAVVSAVLSAASRYKVPLAAWLALCVGLAAIYAYSATPSYTATATILLEPRRQMAPATQDQLVSPALDISRAESELQVLRSERLLANVFNTLKLASDPEFAPPPPGLFGQVRGAIDGVLGGVFGTPKPSASSAEEQWQRTFETFVQRVAVRRVGQSYVVEVSFTANDPTLARRATNALASAYLWQSIDAKASSARNGAEFLQGRVNSLAAQARAALAGVTNGTLPEVATPDADARVIGEALQPLRPSAPRKGLILALGAMIGIVGGFLGVAVAHTLDRRIRTAKDIVHHTGLPCLATLPDLERRFGRTRAGGAGVGTKDVVDPTGAFGKGIRDLRTSLQLSSVGRSGEMTVALLACAPEAGTSLIALSLARLIRESGLPVTLIDGNMQGTTPWPPLGPYPYDGDCLAELLLDSDRLRHAQIAQEDGLALIPARSSDPLSNGRAYLGAPAFQQIVEHMRQHGNVILDLPAFSATAETRAAAQRAEAVVLVARAGRTTIDELTEAAAALRSVGAHVIGVALNRA